MIDLLISLSISYFHFLRKENKTGIDPVNFKHDAIEHGVVFHLLGKNIVANGNEEQNILIESFATLVNLYLEGQNWQEAKIAFEEEYKDYPFITKKKGKEFWFLLEEEINGYEKEIIGLYTRSSTSLMNLIGESKTPEQLAARLLKSL